MGPETWKRFCRRQGAGATLINATAAGADMAVADLAGDCSVFSLRVGVFGQPIKVAAVVCSGLAMGLGIGEHTAA